MAGLRKKITKLVRQRSACIFMTVSDNSGLFKLLAHFLVPCNLSLLLQTVTLMFATVECVFWKGSKLLSENSLSSHITRGLLSCFSAMRFSVS